MDPLYVDRTSTTGIQISDFSGIWIRTEVTE